jgi:hypothetical protein
MALPNPGNSISLSQINTELGRSATAQVSLNTAEDSGYVAINGCSQYRPRPNNPAKFSEWFSYNHSATCYVCYNGSNAITGSFSVASGGNITIAVPISFQSTIGESTLTLITSNVSGGDIYASVYFGQYNTTYNQYVFLGSPEASIFTGNITNTTVTSVSNGIRTADYTGTDGLDYILLNIGANTGSTRTGNYELRFSCPTITTCGNTLTTAVGNCMAEDWHWMDAGTSSRNITLTYSLASGFNATPKLTIKDENNNVIVNAATVSAGSNQTYTFSFTYNGYRYIKILFYDDYSC